MKKSFLILAALLLTLTASAQLKFGVKGGLNITDMKFDNLASNLEVSNRAGFFVGPTLKFTLPVIGLGIDAAALYDQREAELGTTDKETIKRQAINIPLNLRYGIGLGDLAEVFVKAGPQFGFNIGDKDVFEALKGTDAWTWKSSELSVNLGVGVTVIGHLEVAANYNIVCGKTSETSFSQIVGTANKEFSNKNNAWQISAAYYF